MKKKVMFFLLFVFAACRKESSPVTPAGDFPLAEAKAWYESRFPRDTLQAGWTQAQQMPKADGPYWLAPLPGRPGSDQTGRGYRKLAIFRSSDGAISARFLDFLPDPLYFQRKGGASTGDFTGRIFIYDEEGRLLGGRVIAEGKAAGLISKRRGIGPLLMNKAPELTGTCTWQDNNYINTAGEVVVYSEKICTYSQTGDPFSSGGSGSDLGSGDYAGSSGGAGASPPPANLPGENNPAIDPKRYMDCFGGLPDAGAKMKITVYVQEPFPGTSFNIGPNSVGHVAIALSKTSGSQTVTQVLGFYPDATGLAKLHARSKLVNNSNLDFDVSISYTISAAQFNKIVAYVASPPTAYDVKNFNCTNFVFEACGKGGITLPNPLSTVGMNGAGGAAKAMTPAGLGTSIEKTTGTNVNKNGGTMPNSKGPC